MTKPDLKRIGHFRNNEAEKLYKQAYQTAMETLPQPAQTVDVPTSYGTVRVYKFRSENTTSESVPIVLLPGRSSGVPMWGLNLPGLVADRTVYALDALGDAGLSVQSSILKDTADQAKWLEEVFKEMHLEKFHLVGHSFGGWLAANYATRFPERLATLSLLEPVFVFQGLRWQVYLQATLAIIPFIPQKIRDRMLSQIGGGAKVDRSDPIAALVAGATAFFDTRVPQPVQITKNQLQQLSMPVYVAIGGQSAMHIPEAAQRVAEETLKKGRVKLWPQATHSLPMEFATEVDKELLEFMDQATK